MPKKSRVLGFGLGLAMATAYEKRRTLLARLLKLGPVKNAVGINANIDIPMQDGVILKADHYYPKAAGTFPTVLIRTPYGRGSKKGGLMQTLSRFQCMRFAERGYHVLIQDTRGRFESGGHFEPLRHEAPDGHDTVEWLKQQDWFDGRLSSWGSSYVGITQWAVAAGAPGALKAMGPSITGSQFYSLTFRSGTFALDIMLQWVWVIEKAGKPGLPEPTFLQLLKALSSSDEINAMERGYKHLPIAEADVAVVGHEVDFYREWFKHPDQNEPYWQKQDFREAAAATTAPVNFTSGWYDILLPELLGDYARLREAGQNPYLTIGPWIHVAPAQLMTTLRDSIIWFDAHLKGERQALRSQPVRIFVVGANEWQEFPAWPPPSQPLHYFLHAQKALSLQAATIEAPDTYRYDPADPTPSVGGPRLVSGNPALDNRTLGGAGRCTDLHYRAANGRPKHNRAGSVGTICTIQPGAYRLLWAVVRRVTHRRINQRV